MITIIFNDGGSKVYKTGDYNSWDCEESFFIVNLKGPDRDIYGSSAIYKVEVRK